MIEIADEGRSFTVPAETIAAGLKLTPAEVQPRLADGSIATGCETGTGADAGTWRLTFSTRHRRLRLIVDAAGAITAQSVLDFGSEPLPPATRRPGAV